METDDETRRRLIAEFTEEAAEIGRRLDQWATGNFSISHNRIDVSSAFVEGLRRAKADLEDAVETMRQSGSTHRVTDHVDFDFELSFGRSIPEYGWRNGPWRGRATAAAVRLAHGPIPDGMPLADAFVDCSTGIRLAAANKVVAAEGNIDEPVMIDADDLMT